MEMFAMKPVVLGSVWSPVKSPSGWNRKTEQKQSTNPWKVHIFGRSFVLLRLNPIVNKIREFLVIENE